MAVKYLQFTNLGPFEEAEFSFDSQVNVFVGPNNSGKTTALLALASILSHTFGLPRRLKRGATEFTLVSDVGTVTGPMPMMEEGYGSEVLGKLRTLSGELGFIEFVPALRLATEFRSPGPRAQAELFREPISRPIGAHFPRRIEVPWSWVRDDTIIQRAIELDYKSYRDDNPNIRLPIEAAIRLASNITEGFPLEFDRVVEDNNGLFLQIRTPDGPLPLDSLSQGTQSIIQWCVRLAIGYAEHFAFPDTFGEGHGILIVDEIDAHLHPSWQRRVVTALTQTFPALQIFCSTHSPMTIAGLKAGQVHLLNRDSAGKVIVSRNQMDIDGWSADEIYSAFLGVHDPTDLGTTKKLERLRELRKLDAPTPTQAAELETLRDEIHRGILRGSSVNQAELMAESLLAAASERTEGKADAHR